MKCRTSNKLKLSVIISTFVLFFMMFFNFSQVNAVALPTADGQYYRFKRANITYEEFDKLIRINESDNIKVYKQDGTELSKSELVGTGMKAVYNGQTNYIIIKGDINGDGKATPTDLSKLKQLLVGTAKFDYCYQKAVDMNNDSQITSVDVSQLKMLLVGLPLPEEEIDPNDKSPRLDGEIEILRSTTEAAHEVTITINWPTGKNLENCKKQVSIDGGKTFKDYEGIIVLKENAYVVARYGEPDKLPAGESAVIIDNIDNIAPDDFTFTAKATTSSITIEAKTIDKLKDFAGNLIVDRCSGVEKYLYKLDDGEWQESNVFENLTQDTEYKIYVKAIDYAGNEKEASNNAMTLRTDTIKEPGQTGIKVEYSKTTPTNEIVTVTFSIVDESLKDNYVIQYQVNSLSGEWTEGTEYQATGNCVIYARLADKSGQASKTYVTANVKNIDHLRPLDFTPEVTYNSSTKKTVVSAANAKDAPADATNMCSGLANIYYFTWIYKDGTQGEPSTTPISSNKYEISGDLINNPDKTNPIIGFYVEVQDKVGNTRTSQVKYIADVSIDDGGGSGGGTGGGGTGGGSGSGGSGGSGGGGSSSGVGRNYNDGPGNKTIQGAQKSYNNPVIPVGFKAVDTPDASWGPYLPSGWDNGLVIEDRSGNQFIWVPVPCKKGMDPKDAIDNMILNMRPGWGTQFKETMFHDLIPELIEKETKGEDKVGKYGYNYSATILEQVKEYQGFYIGRYEAGNKNGNLAVQKGLEGINNLEYAEAKQLAESMYQTPYVISGLPTGVQWDLTSAWVAQERGVDYVTKNTSAAGNIPAATFKFSGKYVKLPKTEPHKVEFNYINGVNVTKVAGGEDGQRVMLATGIVEQFKVKNAYDFWGNFSEYCGETADWAYFKDGSVRGWNGMLNSSYGQMCSSNISGMLSRDYYGTEFIKQYGFRPVLFLAEGLDLVDYNRTIDGGTASASNPIIPAGYYPVNTGGANWGDGKRPAVDWNKGLVITDALDANGKSVGNEFVWVPVDGTNVKYEKWLEVYLQHSETGASEMPESLKKKGYTEEKMVTKFGGFYIARYETSLDSSGNAATKANQKVNTNVSYNQAVNLINKYPNKKTSTVGIVTGKQWDTTMKWISNQIGRSKVESDSSSWGVYRSSLGNTGRKVARNIYDLAGNAWELTSETFGNKIVYRGGSAYNAGSSAPAGYRDAYAKEYSDGATTFRMCLYVEGDNYGSPEVPVPDTGITIEFKQSTTEKTDKVTVTMTTNSDKGHIEYAVTPDSTGKQGEWKKGNSVEVTENCTISAKVVDDSGKAISAIRTHKVTNIGEQKDSGLMYLITPSPYKAVPEPNDTREYWNYKINAEGWINICILVDENTDELTDVTLFGQKFNTDRTGRIINGKIFWERMPISATSLNGSGILKDRFKAKYPNIDISKMRPVQISFKWISFMYKISNNNYLYLTYTKNNVPGKLVIPMNEVTSAPNFPCGTLPPVISDDYWINVDTYLSENGGKSVSLGNYDKGLLFNDYDNSTKSYGRYTLHLTSYRISYSDDIMYIDLQKVSDIYPEGSDKEAVLGGCLWFPHRRYPVMSGAGTKDDPFIVDAKFPIYEYLASK